MNISSIKDQLEVRVEQLEHATPVAKNSEQQDELNRVMFLYKQAIKNYLNHEIRKQEFLQKISATPPEQCTPITMLLSQMQMKLFQSQESLLDQWVSTLQHRISVLKADDDSTIFSPLDFQKVQEEIEKIQSLLKA